MQSDSDSSPTPPRADRSASPFEPTPEGVAAFLTEILGPGEFGPIAEALDQWVAWTSDGRPTVGLSLSGPPGQSQSSFDSLAPLIEGGFIDWLVTPAEDLYLDAARKFEAAGAGPDLASASQVERLIERIRLRDATFTRRQVQDTKLFFERVILLAGFQGTLSTAELNALYGKFLLARDEHFGIETHSLLAEAARVSMPLFSNLTDGSVFGRQIAAAALTGNRLVVDPSRDLNFAAGLVLQASETERSVVACLGGGPPRDLVLQASRHLGHLLGAQPGYHNEVLEVAAPGRRRLEAFFAELWPSEGPVFRGIELAPVIAVPLLAAFWIQRRAPREPRALLNERDGLLEGLRDAHLRDDLERQVRETGAQLQAGVREAQGQFQNKLEEQRATIQTEVQRLQSQVQGRLERFLKQVRAPGASIERRSEDPTDSEDR